MSLPEGFDVATHPYRVVWLVRGKGQRAHAFDLALGTAGWVASGVSACGRAVTWSPAPTALATADDESCLRCARTETRHPAEVRAAGASSLELKFDSIGYIETTTEADP